MGTPESELIALIRKSRVAFDVSDEMVEELGFAGIPRGLLDAMIAKQVAQDAADNPGSTTAGEPEEAADTNPAGEPTMTILLNDDGKGVRREVPSSLVIRSSTARCRV